MFWFLYEPQKPFNCEEESEKKGKSSVCPQLVSSRFCFDTQKLKIFELQKRYSEIEVNAEQNKSNMKIEHFIWDISEKIVFVRL